jgi:sirohydrochlorin ferrochelatase
MIVALVDNGSLEPAAHRNLRAVAAALAEQTGVAVHAVSWKHSDRIAPDALGGTPAWTLAPFVRRMHALGQRDFVFVPFFVSAQGAIGSALRGDLEKLQAATGGFDFTFSAGLADRGALPAIVEARIRETIAAAALVRPAVVLADHGGPSPVSAALRDHLAAELRARLGSHVAALTPASMEGEHPPLLADALQPHAAAGTPEVVVALLFLSPGRHAGAGGDIAQICAASGARCRVTELIGNHPLAAETLAAALRDTLATVHAPVFS